MITRKQRMTIVFYLHSSTSTAMHATRSIQENNTRSLKRDIKRSNKIWTRLGKDIEQTQEWSGA